MHPQFGRDTHDDQLEWIVRDSGRSGGDDTPKAKKAKIHHDGHSGSIPSSANQSREHQQAHLLPDRLVGGGAPGRHPGPALRAWTSLSSRDDFSTSRVESTGTRTEMRMAQQLMLEKNLMSQVLTYTYFYHDISSNHFCFCYTRNLRCSSSRRTSGRFHTQFTHQVRSRWSTPSCLRSAPRRTACLTSSL